MTNLWLALVCKVPCAMCYTNNRSCYTIDMSCDKARKHLARKHLATSTTHPGSTCGQSGRYIRVGREEQTRKGSQLDVAKLFLHPTHLTLDLSLASRILAPCHSCDGQSAGQSAQQPTLLPGLVCKSWNVNRQVNGHVSHAAHWAHSSSHPHAAYTHSRHVDRQERGGGWGREGGGQPEDWRALSALRSPCDIVPVSSAKRPVEGCEGSMEVSSPCSSIPAINAT